MRHISVEELVDLAEGRNVPGTASHLAACERCRDGVEQARLTIALARQVDVPEPSPLFWEALPHRVARAIDDSPRSWWTPVARWEWLRAPATAWTVALVLVMGGLLAGLAQQGPVRRAAAELERVGASPEYSVSLQDDESLSLLSSLTEKYEFDTLIAGTLSSRPGMAERAALDLSNGERTQLMRLLASELR
jgi:hypothetical protein